MTNHINPSRESFGRFRAVKRDGPVQMLNLIKYRDTAAYDDGTSTTGAAAYKTYIKFATPFIAAVGARVIWTGRPEVTLIGPDTGEDWDAAFIVEYPSAAAFETMVRDPGYQAISHHRTAGVENSRLVRMAPVDSE